MMFTIGIATTFWLLFVSDLISCTEIDKTDSNGPLQQKDSERFNRKVLQKAYSSTSLLNLLPHAYGVKTLQNDEGREEGDGNHILIGVPKGGIPVMLRNLWMTVFGEATIGDGPKNTRIVSIAPLSAPANDIVRRGIDTEVLEKESDRPHEFQQLEPQLDADSITENNQTLTFAVNITTSENTNTSLADEAHTELEVNGDTAELIGMNLNNTIIINETVAVDENLKMLNITVLDGSAENGTLLIIDGNITIVETILTTENVSEASLAIKNVTEANLAADNASEAGSIAENASEAGLTTENVSEVSSTAENASEVSSTAENVSEVSSTAGNTSEVSSTVENVTEASSTAESITEASSAAENVTEAGLAAENVTEVNLAAGNITEAGPAVENVTEASTATETASLIKQTINLISETPSSATQWSVTEASRDSQEHSSTKGSKIENDFQIDNDSELDLMSGYGGGNIEELNDETAAVTITTDQLIVSSTEEYSTPTTSGTFELSSEEIDHNATDNRPLTEISIESTTTIQPLEQEITLSGNETTESERENVTISHSEDSENATSAVVISETMETVITDNTTEYSVVSSEPELLTNQTIPVESESQEMTNQTVSDEEEQLNQTLSFVSNATNELIVEQTNRTLTTEQILDGSENDTLTAIEAEGLNDTLSSEIEVEGLNDTLSSEIEVESLNDTLSSEIEVEGLNDTLSSEIEVEGLNDTLSSEIEVEGLNLTAHSTIDLYNVTSGNASIDSSSLFIADNETSMNATDAETPEFLEVSSEMSSNETILSDETHTNITILTTVAEESTTTQPTEEATTTIQQSYDNFGFPAEIPDRKVRPITIKYSTAGMPSIAPPSHETTVPKTPEVPAGSSSIGAEIDIIGRLSTRSTTDQPTTIPVLLVNVTDELNLTESFNETTSEFPMNISTTLPDERESSQTATDLVKTIISTLSSDEEHPEVTTSIIASVPSEVLNLTSQAVPETHIDATSFSTVTDEQFETASTESSKTTESFEMPIEPSGYGDNGDEAETVSYDQLMIIGNKVVSTELPALKRQKKVFSGLPLKKVDHSTEHKWQPYVLDCDIEIDEKGHLCEDWAMAGLCITHRPTMFLFCRRTCLCVGPPELQ